MKHSINKIFNNLSMFLILTTLAVGLVTLLVLEQNSSYSKINNLKNQKELINSLANLQKKDIELALIQFNGKSTQLQHEIEKLRNLNKYDYTGKFLLGNSEEYLSDLDNLSKLTTNFNKSAHEYYIKNLENEEEKNQELKNIFSSINKFLDSMIIRNIGYNEEKFYLLEKITVVAFILTFITTFWYRRRLKSVYGDILHLYAIDNNKKDYVIFSQEADAIQLRMNRKPVVTDNPAMLDPVTQINNHKGMLSSYSNKKGMKDSNFTSVTIFEIDNFSKQKRAFSQEFTQAILKKVAFTISLHEQATDVIARTDYNQFTVILSRASKEQSFKDIDIIRQSISEIKFKAPGGDSITITASGGFIIKPNNQSLDESLRQAKEVLQHAKKKGKNSISQIRDVAEHEL
ncbi:membrane protein containing GGDEF domain [Sulfurimonas gotlandica GD1]|uniref:diguanylate cyclase n=1 Tax=Sulfurimonas gotlandica (strain DSM 19862 / JCM 16533 / GD1) TaxID=929558 RepID=B6BJQ3_SULGG|nr:GGDEF domain-containing protein [Sulfurimonas gotlandica]EDZ62695.1 GGDEF domain protein [Sulfurimonas gotlandica GD1]EHP31300.1 membrane protein containing GGDEF domain [Sulfurimonas gotlandica GD1]